MSLKKSGGVLKVSVKFSFKQILKNLVMVASHMSGRVLKKFRRVLVSKLRGG